MSLAFSRAVGSLLVFALSSYFNPCDTFFALIGRFYYFAFVLKIFNLNLR